MKKILVVIALFLCTGTSGAEKKFLTSSFPREKLSQILIQPKTFAPVPVIGDNYWQSVPEGLRQAYITNGEQYLGQPWPVLPVTLFSEFVTTGNRTNFQQHSFQRRTQLNSLVMAELFENKGRFMNDIINGIWAMCEETWWGIPAHYNRIKVSLPETQTVDLFNAETGGQLAWINYILKAKLDEFSPLVSQRLESEIKRRIIDRALADTEWWMTSPMNWNTWICSNWLACVLFVEPDRDIQLRSVEKILGCLDVFIDEYPDDGGCDEGPGYWNKAAGSLYENLQLLGLSTNGQIDLSKNQKIINMGSFIYKTYIGNGYGVNFADANPRVNPTFSVLYQFGRYINDPTMMEFAAWTAQRNGYAANPTRPIRSVYPNRDLIFLKDIQEFLKQEPKEPTVFSSWLPDLQIAAAHSVKNSNEGLFFAVKGGHNDENHNHNDIGNFVVYNDMKPVIVDIGSGTYTALTFVNETRYKIFTMQSGYHNCPKINGQDQPYGRQYAPNNVSSKITDKNVTFTLDIAGAYNEDAKVKSWIRTCNLVRGKQLEVEEKYQLSSYVSPTQVMLITPYQTTIQNNGLLELVSEGDVRHVKYDPKKMTAEIETIAMDDEALVNRWGQLYRIKLTITDKSLAGSVKYSIY